MRQGNKMAESMLKSIEKIGKDISEKDGISRTQEVTKKLKESKQKFSDILGTSYDEAFNISK